MNNKSLVSAALLTGSLMFGSHALAAPIEFVFSDNGFEGISTSTGGLANPLGTASGSFTVNDANGDNVITSDEFVAWSITTSGFVSKPFTLTSSPLNFSMDESNSISASNGVSGIVELIPGLNWNGFNFAQGDASILLTFDNITSLPTLTVRYLDPFVFQTVLDIDTDPYVAQASGVVPVPAAVWLFGSGLLGLAGIARKK